MDAISSTRITSKPTVTNTDLTKAKEPQKEDTSSPILAEDVVTLSSGEQDTLATYGSGSHPERPKKL